MSYQPHDPVLANSCLNLLGKPQLLDLDEFWMVDCTFGAGGHSLLFLKHFPKLKILAIDQDEQAIEHAKELLQKNNLQDRITLIQKNFSTAIDQIKQLVQNKNVQIILADIGVSSHHLDSAERGFSYRQDGPLDMRMDKSNPLSAEDVVNSYSEKELQKIFSYYGEEPFAARIAKNIVTKRKEQRISTTSQLEEICFLSYPNHLRHRGKHPALLVFQALRLCVNQELEVLEETLPQWFQLLSPGGRLGVISFHSLEDRIVKKSFNNWSKELWSDTARIITKKPIQASADELIYNPRARSAKLRVIEHL